MITIGFVEPEPPTTCDCCGGDTWRLTRFVDRDGDAHAVCYLTYTDNHPEKLVKIALSLGEWWLERSPRRRCFTIWYRDADGQAAFMLRDPADNPWRTVERLGRALTREQALRDDDVREVWRIIDRLWVEDPHLRRFLGRA